jgi:uncharacterized protein (AIM24 family)
MPFCTNCGTRLEVESSFCVGCGRSLGSATRKMAAATAPAAAPEPLDYTIQGENLQVVRIRLRPGQEVFADAGKMVYKFPEVQWEKQGNGNGSLARFYAASPSEVGFSGASPGRIQAFNLKEGQSMLVAQEGFLCAQTTARLGVAPVAKPGVEGLTLKRLTGPGTMFIHGGGDFIEFVLNPGQAIQVETSAVVAFDDAVSYGIETESPAGEGPLLATMTGPGRVVIQSMTAGKSRRAASLPEPEMVPALN